MNKKKSVPVLDIKKYGGKQVALRGNKVIASGKTLAQVVARVRRLSPAGMLSEGKIFSVPQSLVAIYHV